MAAPIVAALKAAAAAAKKAAVNKAKNMAKRKAIEAATNRGKKDGGGSNSAMVVWVVTAVVLGIIAKFGFPLMLIVLFSTITPPDDDGGNTGECPPVGAEPPGGPPAAPPAAPPGKHQYNLGPVQPQAAALAQLIGDAYDIEEIGGWRESDGYDEHVTGRALDFMTTDKAKGDAIMDYLIANGDAIGVSNVIWWQQIWSAEHASEGKRPMDDRGDDTQNHKDHVHVFLKEDAPVLTELPGGDAGGGQPPAVPGPPADGPQVPFDIVPSEPYREGQGSPEAQKITIDRAQLANISIVSEVARELYPDQAQYERAMMIATITTLVETGANNSASEAVPESKNFPHDNVLAGDHDSVGIFQQRAEQGYYGTVEQLMDPRYQAYMFFGDPRPLHGALPEDVSRRGLNFYNEYSGGDWMVDPPGDVAAQIQLPAEEYRYRYSLWVDAAAQVIAAATNGQDVVDPVNPGDCVEPGPPDAGGPGVGGVQPPSGKVVPPWGEGDAGGIETTAKYGHYPRGGAHYGVDLALGDDGAWTIHSICDGKVLAIKINPRYANVNAEGIGGSTNYIWIDCGNNVYMGYAHFYQRDLNPDLQEGMDVGAGTPLFPQGNQGNSSGPHLHLQISTNASMEYGPSTTTDPIAYLATLGITLPPPNY